MRDEAKKKNWVVWLASAVTIGWIALFGVLLHRSTTCPGSAIWVQLSCLSANELGDLLAGAFAPVAFLWLVAAVFLQKSELEAQRQELRESREVATQQVVEARRNVAFIEEQTAILEQSRKREEMAFVDASIEKILVLFVKTMWVAVSETTLVDKLSRFGKESVVLSSDVERFEGKDFDESVRHFCSQIEIISGQWTTVFDVGTIIHRGFRHIETAVGMLGEIAVLMEKGSPPTRSRIEFLGVPATLTNGLNLISAVRERGEAEAPDEFWSAYDEWWQLQADDWR